MTGLYKPMIRSKNPNDLEEITRELLEHSKVKNSINPEEDFRGLVIGECRSLKLYDFKKGSIETLIVNLPGDVYGMEYYDGTLWISQGKHWSGVGSLKNTEQFPLNNRSEFFFTYNDSLFDGGVNGIKETFTGKYLINKEEFKKNQINCLLDVFPHNDKLILLVEDINESKNNNHIFYILDEKDNQLCIKEKYLQHSERHNNIASAISVNGKIITTLQLKYLDIDGVAIESTSLEKGTYHRIAFDHINNLLYASGSDIGLVKRFFVRENKESLKLIPKKDLVTKLSNVFGLLLVTKDQVENIREQVK